MCEFSPFQLCQVQFNNSSLHTDWPVLVAGLWGVGLVADELTLSIWSGSFGQVFTSQPVRATKHTLPPQITKNVYKGVNVMLCLLFLSWKELFVVILNFCLAVLLWVHFAKLSFITLWQEKWGLLKSWKQWNRWLDGLCIILLDSVGWSLDMI